MCPCNREQFWQAAPPAAQAEITMIGRAESRDGAKRKRRCYQRRSGTPTRGSAPLRLALTGATRSGSAGVGSLGRDPLARLRRIQVESRKRQLLLGQR